MSKQVAVIGGGPMGLAVAYQLLKDGHGVTLYEADRVLGGMSASFDFAGTRIERYYHFICTADQALFELLEELKLADRLHWTATRMGFYHGGRIHPWGNPVALLRFPDLDLISKLRYGLHAFMTSRRKDWADLDDVEATGWIRRWVGERAYDMLWRSLFELKFYDYAQSLSAAWIGARIRRVGKSRYSVMEEKLGYLQGGSETLLKALESHIEAMGGQIKLATPVEEVVIRDARSQGVRVGGELESADAVVSTAPLPYVPRMIPDLPKEPLERIRSVRNIAVVCVIVKLRRPVTDKFWLNVNDPRMDIPGLVEYTNLNALDAHIVYVPFYMPGEHAKFADSNEVFEDKVRRYLKWINPDLQDADFLALRTSRYRHAQPICEPGFGSRLPPIRVLDNLFVADTSYYYPEDRGISESVHLGCWIARQAG